ncbi:MAG: GTP 3',8-cyclase MoaA [Burkholderiaceae bacterium]|nr:MAG: GTP 3',8-cyclase MoaA [Burkholderiaceae bacterium]
MATHIPIFPASVPVSAHISTPAPAATIIPSGDGTTPLRDTFQRPLRDLRISVTDRCNFRCTYCMPRETFGSDYAFLPHSALLRFEEITRLAKLFVAQGVQKIRITGGEPLLRKELEKLIEMLAVLQTPEGKSVELTLTTNGALLQKKARLLKEAGLTRLTVSLDALDDTVFRAMNDADYSVAEVLQGINTAHAVGFENIKINMVVKRGTNDQEILPFARHFKGSGHIARFIEYMDVGNSNQWQLEHVVPSRDVIARIHAEFPLTSLDANYTGEVAERWRYVDGSGEIGVISSVTQPFCGDCTRARLSTEGKLFTCLFASHGVDLGAPLRQGSDDAQLQNIITRCWQARDDRYSMLRSSGLQDGKKIEMSYIGG